MEENPRVEAENKETEESPEAQDFSPANSEENSSRQVRETQGRGGVIHNILFYFGFARMVVISAIFTFFCLFAIWFFAGQREKFFNVADLRQSCTIMIVIFAIFAFLGLVCLILSIVQNVKKLKRKKTDKN